MGGYTFDAMMATRDRDVEQACIGTMGGRQASAECLMPEDESVPSLDDVDEKRSRLPSGTESTCDFSDSASSSVITQSEEASVPHSDSVAPTVGEQREQRNVAKQQREQRDVASAVLPADGDPSRVMSPNTHAAMLQTLPHLVKTQEMNAAMFEMQQTCMLRAQQEDAKMHEKQWAAFVVYGI